MKKLIISAILVASPIIMYAQQPASSVQDMQAIITQLQEQIKLLQSQVGGLRTELEEVKIELKITRSLQRGAKGEEVEQLQSFLKRLPDIYPEGVVSGFYGALTEKAVKRYQEKQGLEPVGIVGPKTREKLLNEADRFNKEISETPSGTMPAQPAVRAIPGESPAISAIPAQPAQKPEQPAQPQAVSQELWAGEQVKCVFKGSTATQECYSAAGYGGSAACKGTEACVADVKGYLGEQLIWKSSCGGYAYTKIDGQNEYAEFNCEVQTAPAPVPVPETTIAQQQSSLQTSALLPSPCDTSAPRPAGYITDDACSDQEPVVIRRAGGDLVAVFNSGGNGLAVLRSSVSKDNGQTWSEPKFIYQSWDDIGLTEDSSGMLILLAKDDMKYDGIITLVSKDGINWSNPRKVTPTSINNEAGSIMQAKDGLYYVSYSNETNSSGDVYVTWSKDLINWESPIAVTQGGSIDFDSSLIQTADGVFYLAHTSYTDGSTVISSSQDAKKWSVVHRVSGGASAHNGVNLIEINGRPMLFVNQNGNTGYAYPSAGGWTALKSILPGTSFGSDAAVMSNGSVGLVYAHDGAGGQRDIRFTNAGTLQLSAISNNSNLATAYSSISALFDSVGQLQTMVNSLLAAQGGIPGKPTETGRPATTGKPTPTPTPIKSSQPAITAKPAVPSSGTGASAQLATPAIPAQPVIPVSQAERTEKIQNIQQQILDLNKKIEELQARTGSSGQTSQGAGSQSTLQTPIESAGIVISRPLKRGSSGDDVRILQEFLAKDKDVYPEGLATGYFGELTEAAVKRFQAKNNIEQAGIVGPKTRAELNQRSTASGCAAILERPCYDKVFGDRATRIEKSSEEKAFSACMNNSSNSSRGTEQTETSFCQAESLSYCYEGQSGNQVRKFEGVCDAVPIPTPIPTSIPIPTPAPTFVSTPTPTPSSIPVSPPTISLLSNTFTVTAGQPFTLTVSGASDVGLAAVWWFGNNTGVINGTVVSSYPATPTSGALFTTPVTNPTHLDRAFGSPLFSKEQAVKSYSFSSVVTIPTAGVYEFKANSRDVLYPTAGEPHQASEGAGIASLKITVVDAPTPTPTPTPIQATAIVPDVVTIFGRWTDYFTKNPIANAIVLTWDGSVSRSVKTNLNGEFAISATTTTITTTAPKGFGSWPTCYEAQGFALFRKSDGSMYANLQPFVLTKESSRATNITSPEVRFGDIPFWPSVDIQVNSDILVKFNIEYNGQGGGGNSLFKTTHYLSNAYPLNADARIKLIDQSGNIYYSPVRNLPLSWGCAKITLDFLGGQFIWR